MISLGIDIGGTSVKLAAIDEDAPPWTGQSAAYFRPSTCQLIDAIEQAANGRSIGAQTVGICVPGLLDRLTRTVTAAVNVPGLVGLALDDLVARALGHAIARLEIINDALAAGTHVSISLALSGRVLSMALGTGVGMGVLDDGKPLLVEGDSSGHIGQIDVSIEGDVPIGLDGGAGSLEAYIGAPALIQRYGSTERFLKTATVADPPLRSLARAIRIGHAIYRPHHIVLVGGIGTRIKHLLPDLKAAIDRDLSSIARPGWTLITGQHDFHAALGAARLAAMAVSPAA